MGSKKAAAACLVLAWAAASVPAQEAPRSLIRKELLVFGSGQIAPPLRDIFRPKAAGTSAPPRAGKPAAKAAPVTPAAAAPSFNLNISYIGSVKSGGRTIALVLRGGQTVSVGEGDEIAPGYKVVRVTAEEIVVEGPNAERKTFALQGDRP
jgi:hypothetical protein